MSGGIAHVGLDVLVDPSTRPSVVCYPHTSRGPLLVVRWCCSRLAVVTDSAALGEALAFAVDLRDAAVVFEQEVTRLAREGGDGRGPWSGEQVSGVPPVEPRGRHAATSDDGPDSDESAGGVA